MQLWRQNEKVPGRPSSPFPPNHPFYYPLPSYPLPCADIHVSSLGRRHQIQYMLAYTCYSPGYCTCFSPPRVVTNFCRCNPWSCSPVVRRHDRQTRLRQGERAFSVATPRQWNLLPSEIRCISNTEQFKRHLKTFLFKSEFSDC